jgi:NAD+ synthase
VVPEYGAGWKCKLALSRDAPQHDRLNLTSLVVERPDGERRTVRLRAGVFRQIVAATNFKQRVRAMMTYYHADRLHFAVAGTPNRLEFDQGFFVKGGDGLADIKPLAHLYKAQVYELGEFLGVSEEILSRAPTTDTYSLPQSQEEFYFSLDPVVVDRLLLDFNMRRTVEEASSASGLAVDKVQWIWNDFVQKRARTRYLHLPAVLTEAVELSEQVEERSG